MRRRGCNTCTHEKEHGAEPGGNHAARGTRRRVTDTGKGKAQRRKEVKQAGHTQGKRHNRRTRTLDGKSGQHVSAARLHAPSLSRPASANEGQKD